MGGAQSSSQGPGCRTQESLTSSQALELVFGQLARDRTRGLAWQGLVSHWIGVPSIFRTELSDTYDVISREAAHSKCFGG